MNSPNSAVNILKFCDNHYKISYLCKLFQYSDCYFVRLLYLYSGEELFDSKHMHIAEIVTVAKSLPLLR